MNSQKTTLDAELLIVKSISRETKDISSYELVSPTGGVLPSIAAGAHLVFHLENGLTRYYSIYTQPGESDSYQVAVLNDPLSRGGSAFIHSEINAGDSIKISGPKNNFPISEQTKTALLIAGGIGVTPLLSMAREFYRQGIDFKFHYCAKTAQDAAFVELLKHSEPYSDSVSFHFDNGDPSKGINLKEILGEQVCGSHLYCCGPNGLMDAVESASSHWQKGSVHFERFKASETEKQENTAFKVVLSRSDLQLDIPADKSILQVLRENGREIESLCEEGICGSCLTDVLEGEPEHRDQILTAEEKEAQDVIAICCSRAKSSSLVLDI